MRIRPQFASSVSKITVSPDCMATAGGLGPFQEPLEAKTRICPFKDGKITMKLEEPGAHLEI